MTETDAEKMKKVVITTFTDPMMGLSYESEPTMRRVAEHYGETVEWRYAMGLLVRDVHDFMIPADYADTEAESIKRYNARLAQIYKSEEAIGGLPMNMEGFCLFSENERSSLPLNLAYEAAKLANEKRAEKFLRRLRYATVVETRRTTTLREILRVVSLVGIDEEIFLKYYNDGSAMIELKKDLALMSSLGIHSLPAYLLEYGERRMLIRQLADFDLFRKAIERVKG